MTPSSVLSTGVASPAASADYMAAKLAFHTDAADVAADLKSGAAGFMVLDVRAREAYLAGHLPGAVSFPHREITATSTAHFDRDLVYVTYCDGIGCNGSTHGAHKLARLGFKVKELIGGIAFWQYEGYPLATGEAPGKMSENGIVCSC